MTDEELTTVVYNRMFSEQQNFKRDLLNMKPAEILDHAYEYSTREDILCAMHGTTLSEAQSLALLSFENPLKQIFEAYTRTEFKYIEEINTALGDFATSVADDHKRLRNLPVYVNSFEYAKAHNEVEKYRTSFKANISCKGAIEKAISQHYANNCMDVLAAQQVVHEFGFDRTLYVLANTVQLKDWDARFSRANKEWAKTIQIGGGDDGIRDHRWKFVVDKSHPGLTDMFTAMVRHDQELDRKQRASVRERLKAHDEAMPKTAKPSKQKEEVR